MKGRGVVLSLGDRRSWWIGFLAEAVRYAEAAMADRPADRIEQAQFARGVADARHRAFPLPYASAQAIVAALISAGRGLIQAERNPEREIVARLVITAARGLDQLLTADAQSQAEAWKGRMGDE